MKKADSRPELYLRFCFFYSFTTSSLPFPVKRKIKKTLGRIETVSFPELNLFNIEAKIDTGAYTTALHCHEIEVKTENHKQILCARFLDPKHPDYNDLLLCFPEFKMKSVRNSFGQVEQRYVIKTRIRIGRKTILAFVSLSDRESMRYPVLIGRKILKGRFLVDVEFRNLSTPYPKTQ
jgi:hypothetical protein